MLRHLYFALLVVTALARGRGRILVMIATSLLLQIRFLGELRVSLPSLLLVLHADEV
jgi:hypothetical protein